MSAEAHSHAESARRSDPLRVAASGVAWALREGGWSDSDRRKLADAFTVLRVRVDGDSPHGDNWPVIPGPATEGSRA